MNRVKICGMTNPLNVMEISAAKPDFMGFIFYSESPRYVGKKPDMELFQCIPPGIKRIGVFLNEDNSRILDISIRAGLEMVQLHGNESPSTCSQLRSLGLIVIKALRIDTDFSFEGLLKYVPACDYFLFDTKSEKPGGSGRKFDWGKLEEYSAEKPFFLSGGIGPEDTELLKSIRNRGFFAVDINSRFETSPGIKDVRLVKTFIKTVKNDLL